MVRPVDDGGSTTPLPPPPPPTPEVLRTADSSTAWRSIDAMTPAQEAQLRSDVEALPVAERETLINELATKLTPDHLVRMEAVFGREVVAEAVATRSSANTRERYAQATGQDGPGTTGAGSGLSDEAQVAQAQADFEEHVANAAIMSQFELATLMTEHRNDPAYLAELVRLGREDGSFEAVVNPMYGGLYERDGNAYRTDSYGGDGPDFEARREAFAFAVSSALDRGVLSEADLRDLAVGQPGWQDVATRAGVQQVGATDATRATQEELGDLLSTQSDAQGDVDKLDEELGSLLGQAGPLTPEQQAAFIEAFRNDPEHKPTYDALIESSQALNDYMAANRGAVLDAAVRDPAVAGQVHDAIVTLARSGHGVEALTMLGEIQRVPDSALATAFTQYDDLSGDVLTDAASSAMSELLARNDGSVSAAQEDFIHLMGAFGQGVPVYGGYKDFADGSRALTAFASGDYRAIDHYVTQYNDSKPIFRAFAAAGLVIGAVSAANSGRSEEYARAVEGFAQTGENGARLVSGALDGLAKSGRLAQYSERFAGASGFAARLAPGLGLIASSASLVYSLDQAADGNPGYAIAAAGDVLGVLGSALEFTPAAPAGFIISGIGAIISGIGGFVGELINGGERREQIEGYLREAGVDPGIVDEMAREGGSLFQLAETLGMSAEDVQSLLQSHPEIALSPGHAGMFERLADASGLRGAEVLAFADRLAQDDPNFAWDLMGISDLVPDDATQAPAWFRDQLESRFASAAEYVQQQSPELFGEAAEQREMAIRQFEEVGGYDPVAMGNLLIDNDDPVYRAEIIRQLDEGVGLENFAQDLGGYGGEWADASRAAIADAVDAGVISQAQADEVLPYFG